MSAEDLAMAAAAPLCEPSCGAESASSSSPPPASVSLLFSLQFYVDRVALDAAEASQSPSPPDAALLLGFQLLQYEIVVFDAALASPATRLGHGKSCLFQADPDELRLELQREAEAPLTLLLLTRERGRARLRAFAAVPLELHVALQDDDAPLRRSLLRVCEWASLSGSWELRDHRNAPVGRVAGAVTLSCLGKTLAPHLTQALGVQVSRSRVETQQKEQTPTGVGAKEEKLEEEEEKQSLSAGAEVTLQEDEKVETQDSSVQCDELMLVQDAAESTAASPRGRSGAVQVLADAAGTSKSTSIDGQLLYYKSNASSPRRIRSRPSRESRSPRNAPIAVAAAKSELLFPRELPPPLFFQKAPRRAKS